ncbi:hypothetical protein KJ705_00645 [Patescibacteria group bacterium]|nr:hypothetical protein [Patescibacteria group bacterium]
MQLNVLKEILRTHVENRGGYVLVKRKQTISQVRRDGALGVEFNSKRTLARYLSFVKRTGGPETRHFIPILENGGIIPRDDDEFQVLLRRMGIMDWAIPNTMRAHFLVTFLQFECEKVVTATASGLEQ